MDGMAWMHRGWVFCFVRKSAYLPLTPPPEKTNLHISLRSHSPLSLSLSVEKGEEEFTDDTTKTTRADWIIAVYFRRPLIGFERAEFPCKYEAKKKKAKATSTIEKRLVGMFP